jgi:ribosome-binding factor A
MPKDRIARVQELIRGELSVILLKEGEMPEKAVITLTRVEAAANLQQARVYISVVPDEKSKEVMRFLQKNIYDIQQQLNERLQMRPVPKIRWVEETVTAQAHRVEELLDKIKEEG